MTVIDTIKDKLRHHHQHDKHADADAEPAAAAAQTQTQTPPTPVSPETSKDASAAPDVEFSDKPVFDANKVTVIFVLGGPGAGMCVCVLGNGGRGEMENEG